MNSPTEIAIGGLVPLSTVDWPGQLVATAFTRGCPWNCPYCHNPHLIGDAGAGEITWAEVRALLEARRALLDGVVFSGGEPTAQPALPQAIAEVRALGFAVGLHTAGPFPDRFSSVLPHLDWVGFDVKAPLADYERITRTRGSGERAFASLRALVASGVDFEARTTVHPDLLDPPALERLADELAAEGVTRWTIQAYRAEGVRPGELREPAAYPLIDSAALRERFPTLTLR